MDLLENVASLEQGVRIKLGVSGAFYGARSHGRLSCYQPDLCSLSSVLPEGQSGNQSDADLYKSQKFLSASQRIQDIQSVLHCRDSELAGGMEKV